MCRPRISHGGQSRHREGVSMTTRALIPVDIDAHAALRLRVAKLEVALAEAILALAINHPDGDFLRSLVDSIIPDTEAKADD